MKNNTEAVCEKRFGGFTLSSINTSIKSHEKCMLKKCLPNWKQPQEAVLWIFNGKENPLRNQKFNELCKTNVNFAASTRAR